MLPYLVAFPWGWPKRSTAPENGWEGDRWEFSPYHPMCSCKGCGTILWPQLLPGVSLPPFRLSGSWWQCSLPLPLQAFVVFLNPAHTSENSPFLNPSYSKKIFIFKKKEIVLSLSPSSLTTWRQVKFTKSETIYKTVFHF